MASDAKSPGNYRQLNDDTFTFELARYDPEVPLVIDPAIVLSSLFGSSGLTIIHTVVADLINPATDLEVFWFGGQVTAGTQLPGPTAKGDVEDVDMFISGIIEVFPGEQQAGLSGEAHGQEELENIAGTQWFPLGTLIMGGSGDDVLNDLFLVSTTAGESIAGLEGSKGPGTSTQDFLALVGTTTDGDTFPGTPTTIPGTQPGTGPNPDCGVLVILPKKDDIADTIEDLDFEIPAPIFADGFESGNVSSWSFSTGASGGATNSQGKRSGLSQAKGGAPSSSGSDLITFGTRKLTVNNSDIELISWDINQGRLVPVDSFTVGGPGNDVPGGLDVRPKVDGGSEVLVSFSEEIQGVPTPVIIDLDLLDSGDFSNAEFDVLAVDPTSQGAFAGSVMFNNNPDDPDRYHLLINGNSFPRG